MKIVHDFIFLAGHCFVMYNRNLLTKTTDGPGHSCSKQ